MRHAVRGVVRGRAGGRRSDAALVEGTKTAESANRRARPTPEVSSPDSRVSSRRQCCWRSASRPHAPPQLPGIVHQTRGRIPGRRTAAQGESPERRRQRNWSRCPTVPVPVMMGVHAEQLALPMPPVPQLAVLLLSRRTGAAAVRSCGSRCRRRCCKRQPRNRRGANGNLLPDPRTGCSWRRTG